MPFFKTSTHLFYNTYPLKSVPSNNRTFKTNFSTTAECFPHKNKASFVHAIFIPVFFILNTACVRNAILNYRWYGNVSKKLFSKQKIKAFLGKFGQVFQNMKKKLSYVEREVLRAKRGRQRTKDETKELRALRDFLNRKYKAIAEEFEQEYARTDGQMDTPPVVVVPPFTSVAPPNTDSTTPIPILSTLDELDLGDINLNLFGDPDLNSTLSLNEIDDILDFSLLV